MLLMRCWNGSSSISDVLRMTSSAAICRLMPASLRDLLNEHEKALEVRLQNLRDQIIPLERELSEVRRARGALTLTDYGPEQALMLFSPADGRTPNLSVMPSPGSPYTRLTIKDLVRKALAEQFVRGATASEMLQFFADAWGRRDIARTSLSPQLSRLKEKGEIVLRGQKWVLKSSREVEDLRPGKTAADQ